MRESVRVVRFVVIGTLNALITAVVVWLMMAVGGTGYILANIVAYLIAQTHNFLWSKYWIFVHDDKMAKGRTWWRQVLLFATAFCMAYALQFLFIVFLVEIVGMNEYLAQFLGLFVYGGVNFCCNRFVTFS